MHCRSWWVRLDSNFVGGEQVGIAKWVKVARVPEFAWTWNLLKFLWWMSACQQLPSAAFPFKLRMLCRLQVITVVLALVNGGLHAEVCYGPSGEQACEDYTHAGSLVEDMPVEAAFEEVLLTKERLGHIPYPLGPEICADDLTVWMRHVEDYYKIGKYNAEQLIPMQNYIMSHHEEVGRACPAAWLMTLLLKIESNLENGRQGRSCARVHATGCLRDARGYWQIYASMRLQYSDHSTNLDPRPINMLVEGEARVLSSFHQSFFGSEAT